MFIVYIIRSLMYPRHYIGCAEDVAARVAEHNDGSVKSTKAFRPWVLVHEERFETRTQALKREKQIKRYKGGRAFQKLIWVGTEAVKRGRL